MHAGLLAVIPSPETSNWNLKTKQRLDSGSAAMLINGPIGEFARATDRICGAYASCRNGVMELRPRNILKQVIT